MRPDCPIQAKLDGRKIGQDVYRRQVKQTSFLPKPLYFWLQETVLAAAPLPPPITLSLSVDRQNGTTEKRCPHASEDYAVSLRDVTVGAVAPTFALLLIISLDLHKTVVFERRTLLGREIVKPRIVFAKDR